MLTQTLHPLKAVILTALELEFRAVSAHLTNHREELHRQGSIYERGTFTFDQRTWEVGIAQIGKGNASAALEAERAIAHFSPQVVFFVGIAGGLKDVHIGDVVAATKVYGYESGKAGAVFYTRPEVGNSTYVLVQRARAEARKQEWVRLIQGSAPDATPGVFVDPIAAGEKVVASTRSAIYRFLRKHYNDALAVEMEGQGFLQATHANQQVQALIVRGISDLIDGKHEADQAHAQEQAARHASAFAFTILAKLSGGEFLYNDHLQRREGFSSPEQTHHQFTLSNGGIIQGPVQMGNHNTIYQNPARDTQKDGSANLQRGQWALQAGDYTTARQRLENALDLLQEDQAPEDCAQVRYLLTLAILNGQRPHQTTLPTMQRIEELMQAAIKLNPTASYLYAFALYKRDFARNGLKQDCYVQEAQSLIWQVKHLVPSIKDQENNNLLAYCQPRLIADGRRWW